MRYSTLLIVAALAAGIPAGSGRSQTAANDAVQAVIGQWEFSNADRDKRCMVTFKPEKGAVGLKLEFDHACASAFSFIKEIAGWTFAENDFLRMLDSKGKALLEFSEVENGIFEAPRPGEGILFLQTAASVEPTPPTADQMSGDWTIMRAAGKPLCMLTLSNTPIGEGGYALKLKPGCDSLITRFNPSSWQMDRGELVLKGARDQTWRFEENDPTRWQRVPGTRDPLLLVRQ